MDEGDSLSLAFMARFNEYRLQESQALVQFTDDDEYQYFRETWNNPIASSEMERLRQRCRDLQAKLDRYLLSKIGGPRWVHRNVEAQLHNLELYDNRAEISKYRTAVLEMTDLSSQIDHLKAQNQQLAQTYKQQAMVRPNFGQK
jgi:hypothetical protein